MQSHERSVCPPQQSAVLSRTRGIQVSRVEESLAEAWQLHRSDAAQSLRPLHHSPPSRQLPPPHTAQSQSREEHSSSSSPLLSFASPQHASGVGMRTSPAGHVSASKIQQHSRHVGADEGGNNESMPLSRSFTQEGVAFGSSPGKGADFDVGQQQGSSEAGGRTEVDRMGAVVGRISQATAIVAGELPTTVTVGPAEYLQWLGDMTSMLVHEQWRKEVRGTHELVCHYNATPASAAVVFRCRRMDDRDFLIQSSDSRDTCERARDTASSALSCQTRTASKVSVHVVHLAGGWSNQRKPTIDGTPSAELPSTRSTVACFPRGVFRRALSSLERRPPRASCMQKAYPMLGRLFVPLARSAYAVPHAPRDLSHPPRSPLLLSFCGCWRIGRNFWRSLISGRRQHPRGLGPACRSTGRRDRRTVFLIRRWSTLPSTRPRLCRLIGVANASLRPRACFWHFTYRFGALARFTLWRT